MGKTIRILPFWQARSIYRQVEGRVGTDNIHGILKENYMAMTGTDLKVLHISEISGSYYVDEGYTIPACVVSNYKS
jgi:hypothetical protein